MADFGLSGLSGQLGVSGGAGTCGTVAYCAPERLADEGCAEQTADVYSFGICMQQMVSGVRPFAELTFGGCDCGVRWREGRGLRHLGLGAPARGLWTGRGVVAGLVTSGLVGAGLG